MKLCSKWDGIVKKVRTVFPRKDRIDVSSRMPTYSPGNTRYIYMRYFFCGHIQKKHLKIPFFALIPEGIAMQMGIYKKISQKYPGFSMNPGYFKSIFLYMPILIKIKWFSRCFWVFSEHFFVYTHSHQTNNISQMFPGTFLYLLLSPNKLILNYSWWQIYPEVRRQSTIVADISEKID